MGKVVIYTRVSTKEQLQGGSLATQLRTCMTYAMHHCYEVARVFQEEGESAKTADRTELQKMLAYCKEHAGEIDGVVVFAVDRFSRNMEDFVSLRKELERHEIRLLLATREVEDTPEGEFVMNMDAALAQLDNARRAVRTVVGMRDAAEEGKWVHQAPLGYLDACKTGRGSISPDPERAPLVREAWCLIDAGYSEAEALRMVTAKGLTNKRGKEVPKQTFSKMLRNPLYMGVVETMGVRTKSSVIEPIVEEDLWLRVKRRLDGKKHEPSGRRKANPEYPLRGFIEDPEGHRYTGSAPRGASGIRYPAYHCTQRGGRRYPVDKVHREFAALLSALSFDESRAKALREAIRLNYLERHETAENERKRLTKELTVVEHSISAAIDKLMTGVLTDDQAKEYLACREQRKQEIQLRLSELGTTESNVDEIWNFGLGVLSDLSGTWENIANIEVKQRFQRWVFPENLTYDGEEFGTRRIACSLCIKQAKNAEVSTMVPRLQKYSNDDDRRERGGLPHASASCLKKLVDARLNGVVKRAEAALALLAVAVLATNNSARKRVDVGTSSRAATGTKKLVDARLNGVVVRAERGLAGVAVAKLASDYALRKIGDASRRRGAAGRGRSRASARDARLQGGPLALVNVGCGAALARDVVVADDAGDSIGRAQVLVNLRKRVDLRVGEVLASAHDLNGDGALVLREVANGPRRVLEAHGLADGSVLVNEKMGGCVRARAGEVDEVVVRARGGRGVVHRHSVDCVSAAPLGEVGGVALDELSDVHG